MIDMTDIELCHFGEQFPPDIIINEILKINKKSLFMFPIYCFNDILFYLNNCN